MDSRILNDKKLREMFINMSTNRDLRNIINYYNENGLNPEYIKLEFLELMENIDTEEIANRMSIDLFINFDGINISNNELDDALCFNKNCKDVQLEYISKRSDLSYLSIENMFNLNNASIDTLDIAIKNSTNKNIYKINSDKMCLLNKESIFKLLNLAKDKEEESSLVYLASLKNDLTKNEISLILSLMKKNNIKMDNLFAEGLLSQESLTNAQAKTIATFESDPTPMVFEICLEKELYTDDEIDKIYKSSKNKSEIANILLASTRTPNKVISQIYLNGDERIKEKIDKLTKNDIVLQEDIRKLTEDTLDKRDIAKLVEKIKDDIRLIPYAIKSNEQNILDAAYEAIETFYTATMRPDIYEKRKELLRELSSNKDISNITLHHLISQNEDAFSSDEIEQINYELTSRISDTELDIIEQETQLDEESLDDYLLDIRIKSHSEYNDQYYENNDEDLLH